MRKRNSWTIIGYLGKDAQTAITGGGKAVANLSVAINEGYKDKDGVWIEETTWVRVECWGNVYQFASKLRKGHRVEIEGRFKLKKYPRDGQEHIAVSLVARDILLLASTDSLDIEGVSSTSETTPATDEEFQEHSL